MAMATTTATTGAAKMTASTIIEVTKTKNAPIEEQQTQGNKDQQAFVSHRIDHRPTDEFQRLQQDELRSTVQTATVEERRSCPKSKLDDLLLSLPLGPKIVTALSDTFSRYSVAGNHFYSSLGKKFSNGQDDTVHTIIDTTADDAQTTIVLPQPRIVVPPPLVTLNRSTKVKAEDNILFNANTFTIKGRATTRFSFGRKGSKNSYRIEIDHGHYQSHTHRLAAGSGIANGSGTSDGTMLF